MAISLQQENLPARALYHGSITVALVAGKTLKIETSPNGEELLNESVPSGKTWETTISIYVRET